MDHFQASAAGERADSLPERARLGARWVHRGDAVSGIQARSPRARISRRESLDLRRPGHDAMFAHQDDLLHGTAHGCYLSFPSLKNPSATRHTAEIIVPVSYAALRQYRDEPWRRRSGAYQDLKATITRALLDLVERRHPG